MQNDEGFFMSELKVIAENKNGYIADLEAENKRLQELQKYKDIVYQICRDMDEGCQTVKPCGVDEIAEYVKIAIGIARQNGLSQALEGG